MPTKNSRQENSEIDFSRLSSRNSNNNIYIAIIMVIVLTIVAVTGVFFGYW